MIPIPNITISNNIKSCNLPFFLKSCLIGLTENELWDTGKTGEHFKDGKLEQSRRYEKSSEHSEDKWVMHLVNLKRRKGSYKIKKCSKNEEKRQ